MKILTRLCVFASVAATGLVLAATGADAAPVAPVAGHAQASASGTKLWETRYAAENRGAFSYASAVSPDGYALFVTGGFRRKLAEHGADAGITIAYNTATGAQLWQASYNPGGRSTSVFNSIAVSPDGSTVFAAGGTQPAVGQAGPVLIVAYDAATGAARWTDTPAIPGAAGSIAVSPDGSTVFINSGNITAAYNAATGAALWTSSLGTQASARSLSVSPDGSTVFLTALIGTTSEVLMAYDATTGTTRWSDTLAKLAPQSLAVSPDGSAVVVTGFWGGTPGTSTVDARTAAFAAATGAQMWSKTYKSAHGGSFGSAVTVSPDSATVFVTGSTALTPAREVVATWAYDAATGAAQWRKVLIGPGAGDAIAASPGGSKVFVTSGGSGFSGAQAFSTVAYDAASGAQLWVLGYHSLSGGWHSFADSIEVSPDSSKVFVTGDVNTPEPTVIPTMAAVAYSS